MDDPDATYALALPDKVDGGSPPFNPHDFDRLGNALQRDGFSAREVMPDGACCRFDISRYHDLLTGCQGPDTGGGVDTLAGVIVPPLGCLGQVQPDSNVRGKAARSAMLAETVLDRYCAFDSGPRIIKGGEEPVPGMADFLSSARCDLSTQSAVVPLE